jgi:hypothetical protein
MPYSVTGITERNYHGTGLVVDAERGLVLVDRNTVPVSLGDVRLTFAGTLEVPGRVEYMHPVHNLAVVAFDPKLIGDTPVRRAVRSSSRGLEARRAGVGQSGSTAIRWCSRRRHAVGDVDAVISRCRARCSSATPTSRPSRR